MIISLRQEIEKLQKTNNSYDNRFNMQKDINKKLKNKIQKNFKSKSERIGMSPEAENENLNKFIYDLHQQVDELNPDLSENINDIKINTSKNNSKINSNICENSGKNYLNNSNDIYFRIKDENENKNLNDKNNNNKDNKNKSNIIYTISEEKNTNTIEIENLNLDNSNNINDNENILYNEDAFEKMKGSDININYKLESGNTSNSKISKIILDKNSNLSSRITNFNYSNFDETNDININNNNKNIK